MKILMKSITAIILLSAVSQVTMKAQTIDITAAEARNYLDTVSVLSEMEGIWSLNLTSYLTVSDTLASQGQSGTNGSYFIIKSGDKANFRKSYNVYTIDTSDFEVPLEYQGSLVSTSLPGIYNFQYYFDENISSGNIATLAAGRLNFDIIYPDTIVKRIFKDDYTSDIGVYVSLSAKKSYPASFDMKSDDGMTLSYLDSTYLRVRDKSQAAYYRKVTLNPVGAPLGLCTVYYMNGNAMWQSGLSYYDPDDANGDVPYGKCITWYENGGKESVKSYVDGMLNDTVQKWYENGRPSSLIFYKRNVPDGIYKTWFESGSPEVDALFSGGVLIGNAYTVFDEEGQERKVFYETFKNNQLGWPVTETKDYNINIDDEALNINNTGKKPLYPSISAPFDAKWNYELECTMAASDCKDDLFYGVLFGKDTDDGTFQFFAINNKGEYLAGEYINGKMTEYADPKVAESLHTDGTPNTLRVKTWGGMVYYSINEEDVFNTFKKELKGNGLGVYISGKGQFSFDDLSLVVNKYVDDAQGMEEDDE
jgi:hypothetical protein